MEDRERWKEVDRRMFSVLGPPGGSRRSREEQGSGRGPGVREHPGVLAGPSEMQMVYFEVKETPRGVWGQTGREHRG